MSEPAALVQVGTHGRIGLQQQQQPVVGMLQCNLEDFFFLFLPSWVARDVCLLCGEALGRDGL